MGSQNNLFNLFLNFKYWNLLWKKIIFLSQKLFKVKNLYENAMFLNYAIASFKIDDRHIALNFKL